MMAALIMAGRTGAAYAAELGTMQVNEEIDALRTLGISPMEFLVLPRLLAFTLMMPLLAVYANLAGILGGAAIGIGVLGISPTTYYEQSLQFVRLQDVGVGLAKAAVFGLLVAAAGCLRGIRSGPRRGGRGRGHHLGRGQRHRGRDRRRLPDQRGVLCARRCDLTIPVGERAAAHHRRRPDHGLWRPHA